MKIHTDHSIYVNAEGYLFKVHLQAELPMELSAIISLKVGEPMLASLKDGKVFRTTTVRNIIP